MLKGMKIMKMRIVTIVRMIHMRNMSTMRMMTIMRMMTTKTMILQFRVTTGSGASLLDILGAWGGIGYPLLPDPTAYQVFMVDKNYIKYIDISVIPLIIN